MSRGFVLAGDPASGNVGPVPLPSAASTLGAVAGGQTALPFRDPPVFLRLVQNMKMALDYAAGGFHVSAARSEGGGCADESVSFGRALLGGRKPRSCSRPLRRSDIEALWDQAAASYTDAFKAAAAGSQPLQAIKIALNNANLLADLAFKAEGVEPPRDPGPSASGTVNPPEPPAAVYARVFSPGMTAFASIGAIGAGLLGWHYATRDASGSSAHALMGLGNLFGRKRRRR